MAKRAWKTAAVGMAGGATAVLLVLDMAFWREPNRAPVVAAVEPSKPALTLPAPREDAPAVATGDAVPTAAARSAWRQVVAGSEPAIDDDTTGLQQLPNLVREIQSELTRVGCYDGEPNGVWDRPSRDAASELARHLNASISPERPDHVLLALAENTEGRACRTVCDETANAGCRATAIVAGLPRRMPAVQATGSIKARADAVTSQATAAPVVEVQTAGAEDQSSAGTKPAAALLKPMAIGHPPHGDEASDPVRPAANVRLQSESEPSAAQPLPAKASQNRLATEMFGDPARN